MKKKIFALFFVFCFLFSFSQNQGVAFAATRTVYLGGAPAGFCMETRGAYIAGLSDVVTEDGIKSPSKDAGLKAGDIIYFIDKKEINNASDVELAVENSKEKVNVEYKRCGSIYSTELVPATDISGDKKIGAFIKDEICGIGTITFIDKNVIATLGHPVLNDEGELLEITGGKIYDCKITGNVKGERGIPGELRGVIMKKDAIAKIDKNTEYGVFGTIDNEVDLQGMREIEVGEGKPGNASIFATIEGNEPKEYSVSIIKADIVFADTKNYVIKITDKDLLSATGGIVQGMSGSPIVQNGKLIGAVTHVFINDPTRGFGISINNMLNK